MTEDRVSAERVAFDEHDTEVESLLREYHESVADGFRRWLSDRSNDGATGGDGDAGSRDDADGADAAFSPEAYVDGELEKDLAYLRSNGSSEPLIVARDGDAAVGCVYLYRLSAHAGEVKRLYVRESHRGLGLGRALIATLLDAAAADGYATLRLDTAPFMRSAVGLYRDLGFETFDGGESVSDIPEPMLDEITYMRMDLCERDVERHG